MSQQDRYFSQKLHDLDQAIQDVKIIAYGKYSDGNNSPNQLQPRNNIQPRNKNTQRKTMCENRLPHHQIFELDPKMTSRSETCIIVISDTEAVDDDDVFSS